MYGSAFARVATDAGRTCTVVDARSHVAGAAHDALIGDVHVASYGAHIFHTSSEAVWEFVQRFAEWEPYRHTVKALAGGCMYSLPLNMNTFHALWGVTSPREALEELKRRQVRIDSPSNAKDWLLSVVGEELYELFFHGYTVKQYGCSPAALPASIVQRLPIRLTYDDAYFTAKYIAMPKDGYTAMVCRMLDGVDLMLGVEFRQEDMRTWLKDFRRIVYTGPADVLYCAKLGALQYNSMKFARHEYYGDAQGCSVVNHCDISVPYLRTVEYRHFKKDLRKHQLELPDAKTVVTYDLPCYDGEPFYPVAAPRNLELHKQYEELAENDGVVLGGRLGEYRYYDMDQAIASAVVKARQLC